LEEKAETVFLICNGNAGYFEYFYFQTNWSEFYLTNGVNLVLWNYRGYGRSTGSPYLPLLVDDGVEIVNYIKENFQYSKIGIHGESLGGCIAAHIAKVTNPDFLLCDRTYSSLFSAILVKYGKLAYYLFRLTGHKDMDTTEVYLSFESPKLIVNDPNDQMIKNLSSLKSGVALALFSPRYNSIRDLLLKNISKDFSCIISKESGRAVCRSLKNISNSWTLLTEISTKEEIKANVKTEQGEDPGFKNNLRKTVKILNEIQAGGLRLLELTKAKRPALELQVWFMVLEVWGIDGEETSSFLIRHVAELRILASVMKDLEEAELWKDVEVIAKCLDLVYDGLLERSGRRSAGPDEILIAQDWKKAGGLISVECGHNGDFSFADREKYRKVLVEAGMIEG
jgi:hypothetical protein